MSRFSGKVAIVTGSSNGIGRATALLFAKEGAKVTITGRNLERLEETKQEILKAGVSEDNVLVIEADVTSEEGQNKLFDSTLQTFGRLDILVNNAGAMLNDPQMRTGVDQEISVYEKTMDVNLRSIVTLTQKAKKFLVEAKGEIVNVSSMAARAQVAQPDHIYYAMAKSALEQFTKSAAIDLIQHGVRVNSVNPGVVVTGFGAAMGMPSDLQEKYCRFIEAHKECLPCGFVGQPIHIANVIAFLADREISGYIIGQSIVVDGGSTLVMGMQTHDMRSILAST